MQVGEYCTPNINFNFRGLVEARKNNQRKVSVGEHYLSTGYYYYVQEVEGDFVWVAAGMTSKGKRVERAALSYRVHVDHLRPISQFAIDKVIGKAEAYGRLANELQFGRRDQ